MPKSFLAVNVSGMHEEERRASKAEAEKLSGGGGGLDEGDDEERGRTQHTAATAAAPIAAPPLPQAVEQVNLAENDNELGRLTSLQNVGGSMRTA